MKGNNYICRPVVQSWYEEHMIPFNVGSKNKRKWKSKENKMAKPQYSHRSYFYDKKVFAY